MVKSSPTKLSWKKCPNPSRHQPLLLPDVCGISLIRPHFEREQRSNVFVDFVFQRRCCNSPLFRDSLSSKSHHLQNPHLKPHKKIRFACSFRQKSEEQEWKISVMDTPGWSDVPNMWSSNSCCCCCCCCCCFFFFFGSMLRPDFFGEIELCIFWCVCPFLQVEDLGKISINWMNLLVRGLKLGGSKPSDFFLGVNKLRSPVSVFEGVWYWKKVLWFTHPKQKYRIYMHLSKANHLWPKWPRSFMLEHFTPLPQKKVGEWCCFCFFKVSMRRNKLICKFQLPGCLIFHTTNASAIVEIEVIVDKGSWLYVHIYIYTYIHIHRYA